MRDEVSGPDGSWFSEGLGPLVVAGVTFEPLRLPVPQIAPGLPTEVHVFSREIVLAAVAAERERLRVMLTAHRDKSVMSHHVTLSECHAARNALQLVLDEWA